MNGKEVCPICLTGSSSPSPMHDQNVDVYHCEICGKYGLTDDATMVLSKLGRSEKAKISAYLREREISQEPLITLTATAIPSEISTIEIDEIIRTKFPNSVSERIDRTLQNLHRMSPHLGASFSIRSDKDYPVVFAESGDAFRFMLSALEEAGWIKWNTQLSMAETTAGLSLTVLGWNRIAELERRVLWKDSRQAFVAMSFDQTLDVAFKDGIRKAVEEVGYTAMRVDLKEHNQKICDIIIAEIRKSHFMVADFTGQKPGVYFEAGYALSLGLPVIWTCKKEDADSLHFDTRQYNHIFWTDEADLYQKLKRRIEATRLLSPIGDH